MKFVRRLVTVVAVAAVALATVVIAPAPSAFAADGDVEILKTASVDTVQPGETFSYTLTLTCTTLLAGCTGAQVVDDVPAEFIVDDVAISAGLQGEITQDGQHIEVHFTSPLPGGTVGIPAGATGSVTIQVHADENLPYSANGIPVPNTATTDADTQTSGPLSDTAEVTPVIPLVLDPEVTKTMTPASALANPGEPVAADVTVANASNAPVEQLVISDPADPAAQPSPFDQLDFTGVGQVTYPDGAETAQIVYITASGPVDGDVATAPTQPTPPDVPDEDVIGVQVVFADTDGSGIPVDASGGLEVGFAHPDDVGSLGGNLTVTNIAAGEVELDGQSATDTASATHQIVAADIDVIADKAFNPAAVAAGDTSTATITAGNASDFTLSELTVVEPAMGASGDPYADGFDESMQFAGFTAGIAYPTGATGATITYYYDDGTSEGPTAFADGAIPPAPSGEVVRFEISFTGDIPNGAQTGIPFDVQTDPDQEGYPATLTNVADVSGTDPNGGTSTEQAIADLLVYEAHLEVITGKSIYPTEVLDRPGEWALVTLDAQIAPFPRSTTDADTIVVQDPATTPTDLDGTFWDHFDATQITETAVPDGATLTINYWNGSEWVPLLDENGDAVSVEGPTVFSMDIPADEQDAIEGLQFVFTADDGEPFPPGTTVEPHFTAEVRAAERDTTTVTEPPAVLANCARSEAAGDGGLQSTPSDDDTACAEITVDPYDPDGDGPDVLDKSIDPNVITARSQASARITLNWSTGGLSGVDEVVIQDEAAPPDAAPATDQSFWDAFDIVGVPEITSGMDPHLRFDEITAVQLWDGDSWEDLENDPCPAGCDGAFPGVTLTDTDRERALGIRLVVTESPTRATTAAGDLTAPPVGSGVARSAGNDRQVAVDIRLRDYLRSDPDQPAIGSLDYNTDDGDPAIGTVLDVASVTGTDANDEQVIHTEDSDTIAILDVPLNVDLTKSWSNSPFGIPPDGTPQEAYPTGRVQLNATNRTAAKVDTLTISDPGPAAAENPFTYFDLLDIRQISIPGGTETSQVTLDLDTDGDGIGDTMQDVTVSAALGMTAGELEDVVGITVVHDGRIDAGATAVVEMDLRLREDVRGQPGTRVNADDSPVENLARATVEDAGGGADGNVPSDDAGATVTLADLEIGVEAGKTFDPDAQIEPDDAPVVMTLTGQPTIDTSARVGGMVIGDTAPTFWNAFDFVGIDPSFTLATPINRVRMDARVGGQFIATESGVVHAGGVWQTGEWIDADDLAAFIADPLPELPDGFTAEDVNGIRFGFTSVDAAGEPVQWENPIDPLQEVPVLVQRRAELHTGGAVPSDLSGNVAAPGEDAPGQFTNESTATVCAILAPECAIGEVGTVTDRAEDQIFYQHATSAVTITKQPEGLFAPGQTIPYEIVVTNTGDWPIENPVIVDAPADPGTLMINPDATDPFAYDLQGDAPAEPTGTPLPEDPAQVTTGVDDATDAITFTFPEGSVLEVGQSYTITIDMVFAPGVPGGDPVDNTATVSGDRQFDSCNADGTPADECSATSTVTPQLAGAVRSGKFVRAVDDELGAFDFRDGSAAGCLTPNAPADADPAGDGFYWYPCVPRSKPGGTVEWRFAIQNTGNVDLDRLVLIDRLPTPGDTGAISDLERGSQWTPILDPDSLVAVKTPAGATVSYLVTTDADGDLCTADFAAPGAPGDPLDACGDGYWVDPDSVDPATITAVRTVIDLPDVPLAPGEVILLDATTTTPAQSETAGDDTIAWNSFATGAHTTVDQTSGQGGRTMVPSEGTKVGAALATGAIFVRKQLTGDGVAFAPDTFTVDVQCVSAGEPVVPDRSVDVAVNAAVLVEGLPWGAECTLSESDQGQAGFTVTPETVIAQRAIDGVAMITIVNEFLLASLEVTKTVDSDAVDADGTPIAYGPFTAEVTCTYLGAAVWGDGYTASPMAVELPAGETETITGLPAGAECMVTETDDDGAASTTVTVGNGDGDTDQPIALTPDGAEGESTNTAGILNEFGVGAISLEKIIDPADSPFAGGPYVAQVTCTLDGDTTWAGTVTFDADADDPATVDDDTDFTATIDDIAAGSTCTIVETDDGLADSSVVTPSSVTVPLGDTVVVTITNTYDEGSVTVSKELTGDTTWAADSFEVTLRCIDVGENLGPIAVPGGATRTLDESNGFATTYDPLPAGAFCLLQETDTGGAASYEFHDENGDRVGFWRVEADDARSFTLVNTYETGAISVTKTVTGAGAQLWGTNTFEVSLSCTVVVDGVVTPIPADEIPGGAVRMLQVTDDPATATVVYEQLPPGAECTITETGDGGASDVTLTPADGTVTVGGPDDEVEIAVTNTFDLASIEVTKTVSGDAAEWGDDGVFEVSLSCTWDGSGTAVPIDIPGGATRTLSAAGDFTATYDDLPDGAACQLTETDPAGASEVVITPSGTFTVTPGTVVDVDVENVFDAGGIEVVKTVSGGGAEIGADTAFTVALSCTETLQGPASPIDIPGGATRVLDAGNDYTAHYDGLPDGAECELTEPASGGATAVTITPNDGDPLVGAVTVAEDQTVTLNVDNFFDSGDLVISKVVDGGGAPYFADGPFTAHVTCVLDDGSAAGRSVYDEDVVFGGGQPFTTTITGIPTGSECVITEPDDNDADEQDISPSEVVIGTSTEAAVEVTITNTYTVGSLQVVKALEGDPAAGLAPATDYEYEMSLACTVEVNGEPVDVAIPGGATRTIAGAGTALYVGLPTGAECTVSESDAGHSTSHTISPEQPVVIGSGIDPVVVSVTNVFDNGSVSVLKTVDAPEDFPVPVEFTAAVTCTWQGAAVPLPDDGAVTLVPGTPVVIEDVPIGSICRVVEDDLGQTDATVEPASVTVTDDTAPFEMTIANTYEWASLEVGKVVESESRFVPTQFEFDVVCTFQGATVVDETFTLDGGETETITEIPARSECTVTETDDRGADETVTAADVPGAEGDLAPQIDQETRTVVIPELQPGTDTEINTVTYTNVFDATELVLVKEFAGAGAGQFGLDQTFTFTVTCVFEGETVLDAQVELSAENEWSTAVTDAVAGSECTVTENDLNGADAVVIAPNDGEDTSVGTGTVPADGGLVTITATNWYLTGSVEVTKTFAGDGAELYGTDDFELQLACERDGEAIEIPEGDTRIVNAGAPTALWTTLPTGAECTLTEPDTGGANSTAILDADGDVVAEGGEPYTFTVTTDPTILSEDDQAQPSLQIENTFNLAQVSVTKTVAGTTAVDIDGNPVEYGPFEVELACTWNGGTVTASEAMVQTIADGETVTWTELPEGADCTITETDTMDALATTVQITEAGTTGEAVDGTIAELAPLPNVDAEDQTTVAFVNEYGDPPITITKVVDGTAAADFADRTFTFAVRCVLIDASHPAPGLLLRDATYEVGGPVGPLVTLLPTGAECTITEIDTGGADGTTITVDGVPLDGTTITEVIGTVPMEIVVTNTFDAPLPSTGGTMTWTIPVFALVLIAGGVLALLITRRRRAA